VSAGVAGTTLGAHGAVSEAVARELARGARERCGADIGIGVTGIAGPAGGGPEKPVGLVHVGLDHAGASDHVRCVYAGDRETVRRRTVALALDRLRRRLLAAP
jgi:nicotinamide-nucleotide amidase